MTTTVAILPRGHSHGEVWQQAFRDGLGRHGVAVADPAQADCLVVWGWSQQDVIAPHMALGRDVIVMEQGFLGNRLEWTSVGFNGLNGRADFVNSGSPADRFDRHFADLMKPWKDGGDYALLIGQVSGDQAIAHVDIDAWYRATAKRLANWDLPVMFRSHPMGPPTTAPEGTIGLAGGLQTALDGAAAVVTFNSNVGVLAALAGVPVYAMDKGSMAGGVAADNLAWAPWRPDRRQWANNLAYAQWSISDITEGLAWDHVKGFFKCR